MKTIANLSLFLCVIVWSSISQARSYESTAQIEQVINDFKVAITNKDEQGFLKLFTKTTVSWVGVISSQTMDLLISKDARYAQQATIMPGTPQAFINSIIEKDVVTREETEFLHVTQDGDVASVTFDYKLYENDKLNNWGQENWQLIHTPDGWKINAVNFSFTLNPEVLDMTPKS